MKMNKKLFTPVLILLVTTLVASAVTLALLTGNSNGILNSFIGGTVGCEINEDVTSTPGVKKTVKIKNTGTFDAYIRACVAVNWVDENGNIYCDAPVEGVDYTVTKPETWGFVKSGDVYYCQKPVKPGEYTPVLFTAVTPVEGKAPDGYSLSVEILGSAIQSQPTSAVKDAWKVLVAEGNIVLPAEVE